MVNRQACRRIPTGMFPPVQRHKLLYLTGVLSWKAHKHSEKAREPDEPQWFNEDLRHRLNQTDLGVSYY